MDPGELRSRAVDLPGMQGVHIRELFADAPVPIGFETPEKLRAKIRELTLKGLSSVDLGKIGPKDSVNILASSHGFTLFGGEAYAEMIRTVKDEVERRCGTSNIRLVAGAGLRFRETEESIGKFGLGSYFQGKASGACPVDEGIPIETEIGTLYGIKKVYNADWIIHTHNNDIRELHYHRQIGRLFKPFTMSYATIEMRSAYHQSMGPRAANFLPYAVFKSPFVQNKFVCSVMLQVAPTGIIGVNADNDMVKQDAEFARLNLNWFGKILTMLGKIEDIILVIDYPGPLPYTTAGGILFCNFLNANVDEYDLDVTFPPYTRYSDLKGIDVDSESHLHKVELQFPPPNPAIKALVINYCSKGFPSTFFAQRLPTLVVGAQAKFLNECPQNNKFMNYAIEVKDLKKAVGFAMQFGKTANILAFDGAIGGFNVSEPLAKEMMETARQVAEEVDEVLLPKWLKQRGIINC
jgi:hypothetical protein